MIVTKRAHNLIIIGSHSNIEVKASTGGTVFSHKGFRQANTRNLRLPIERLK